MKTINTNTKMLNLLIKHRNKNSVISKKLESIINTGLIVIDDCLLIKAFYIANKKHLTLEYFNYDYINYETAINGFHIDDFSDNNYLEQGILFLNEIEKIIAKKYPNTNVELILCKTNIGYHFTMHTIRKGITYINDDLEIYQEPTIVIKYTTNK